MTIQKQLYKATISPRYSIYNLQPYPYRHTGNGLTIPRLPRKRIAADITTTIFPSIAERHPN